MDQRVRGSVSVVLLVLGVLGAAVRGGQRGVALCPPRGNAVA